MSDTVQFTSEIISFSRQPNLRDRLKELLDDPVMKLALDALGTLGVPKAIPRHVAGVHHDTTIAHSYHELLGVRKTLTMLRRMTMQPSTAELTASLADEPFSASIPKEFQEPPAKRA